MKAAYISGAQVNQFSYLVGEYNTRKRLATLGIFANINDFYDHEIEALCLIDMEVQKLEQAELKKKHGRRK